MNFLDLEIFLDTYYDEVIVVYSYFSYLGVVFLNNFYHECFCLVDSGVFSCIDEKIYVVLYIFLVYSEYLAVFVYIQFYCVHTYSSRYTIF